MTHILRVETSSSFKWTCFPNTRPRERLSTLNSRQGMEGRMLSPGESIRKHLLNKTSPGYSIRGMLTPSRLGEDIWIRAPKLAPKFSSQPGLIAAFCCTGSAD